MVGSNNDERSEITGLRRQYDQEQLIEIIAYFNKITRLLFVNRIHRDNSEIYRYPVDTKAFPEQDPLKMGEVINMMRGEIAYLLRTKEELVELQKEFDDDMDARRQSVAEYKLLRSFSLVEAFEEFKKRQAEEDMKKSVVPVTYPWEDVDEEVTVSRKSNEELLREYIERRVKMSPLSTGIMMTVGSKENEMVTTEKVNEEEQEIEVREVSKLASSEERLGQQSGVEEGSEVSDIDGGRA